MCFPELLLFALPASSAVVSGNFLNFFRNFDPPFPEKMVKGRFGKLGDVCKRRNYEDNPWIKRFAFATRFPVCKWPSVGFAIQLTNKTSELVAII